MTSLDLVSRLTVTLPSDEIEGLKDENIDWTAFSNCDKNVTRAVDRRLHARKTKAPTPAFIQKKIDSMTSNDVRLMKSWGDLKSAAASVKFHHELKAKKTSQCVSHQYVQKRLKDSIAEDQRTLLKKQKTERKAKKLVEKAQKKVEEAKEAARKLREKVSVSSQLA
jgi:hypothetical protein